MATAAELDMAIEKPPLVVPVPELIPERTLFPVMVSVPLPVEFNIP